MTTLHNEVTIDAPIANIWTSLSNIEELERYDPTVKKSIALTPVQSGIGAIRKVEMKDGKNWFEEKVTQWLPMIRKQSDAGIKKFMAGLKAYAEAK